MPNLSALSPTTRSSPASSTKESGGRWPQLGEGGGTCLPLCGRVANMRGGALYKSAMSLVRTHGYGAIEALNGKATSGG